MAENESPISSLTAAEALTLAALFLVSIEDQNAASGYSSRKVSADLLSGYINNIRQYAGLNTTAKTILGAINELQAGGGGGGSSVAWSQLIGTGTKIAEITINGSTTDVYAPVSGGASYTDVTGTLAAGATSITLQDASILTTSTVDIYTDAFGANPTSVTVATGSVTLTFEAQQSAIGVKARIS